MTIQKKLKIELQKITINNNSVYCDKDGHRVLCSDFASSFLQKTPNKIILEIEEDADGVFEFHIESDVKWSHINKLITDFLQRDDNTVYHSLESKLRKIFDRGTTRVTIKIEESK